MIITKIKALFVKISNFFQHEKSHSRTILFFAGILVFYQNFFAYFRYAKLLTQSSQDILSAVVINISVAIFTFATIALLLTIFSFNKYLLKIVTSLFFVIAGVYNYFVYSINFYFTEMMVKAIILADSNDTSGAFSMDFCIFGVFFIILPLLVIYKWRIEKLGLLANCKNFAKTLSIVISLLLSSFLINKDIASRAFLSSWRLQLAPIILTPTHHFILYTKQALCIKNKKCSAKKNLITYDNFKFKKTKKTKEPLIAIFVLGEALRSDRLSINGYDKETTPRLQKIKNLFAFRNVLTCGTTTRDSVECMLTDNRQDDWIDGKRTEKVSLFDPITKIGFDSYWFSIQYTSSADIFNMDFNGTKNYISRDEMLSRSSEYNDKIVLPLLKENVSQDTLYVIHTRGSHRTYYNKYPQSIALFKPDAGSSKQEQNNAYDNSVLYFDIFMSELIEKFKTKNAFIFYVSDHGESLGEGGYWQHGSPVKIAPKEQRNVPLLIWMSDKFIEDNKDKYFNVRNHYIKNSKDSLDKGAVMHDNVFHTFLDCINLDSQVINKKLSLCNEW